MLIVFYHEYQMKSSSKWIYTFVGVENYNYGLLI
jgi:hypothetical protein